MTRRKRQRRARPGRAGHKAQRAHPRTPIPSASSAERLLCGAIAIALGLLLLTPLIVTKSTVFPYIVGKALWARSMIEIAFALWAVLALARPAYRPPASWLLVLLVAGLCVSLVSAAFGVSPENSLWSGYQRMLGVVDQAHWVALAIVLASFLRTESAWRKLFAANLVIGTLVAGIVIARALEIEVPFYGDAIERSPSRYSGPFGNPIFLSVYMLANLVLAVGFAARALSEPGPARRFRALCRALVALPQLAGLILAGSVGGAAGLFTASAFAALTFAWLARGRARFAAVLLLAVLATSAVGLSVRFFDDSHTATATVSDELAQWPGGRAVRYMSRVHFQRPSVQSRLAAWEAGVEGYAQRPLLGWGPGNYITVFGLFGSRYAAAAEPHDRAHGKLVEVASTTGTAGLVLWCALWGLALLVFLRAAQARDGPGRAFALFAGAALAGHLAQLQFMFDTATGLMLSTFLLAYAVRLESALIVPAWRPRVPGWLVHSVSRGPLASMQGRWPRVLLGAAAVALSVWALVLNQTVRDAANARWTEPESLASGAISRGIETFPPLAGHLRDLLFAELKINWPGLRAQYPEQAGRLLALASREASEAVAREPWNWRIEQKLARLYAAVAETDPQYETAARRHLERARELAPLRAVFPPELTPPGDLTSNALDDGRLRLGWSPAPHAGYHQLARSEPDGAWSAIAFEYDAGRNSRAITPCRDCRYRIRACRTWSNCSEWAYWE